MVAIAAARLSAPGLGVDFGSAPGHVMGAVSRLVSCSANFWRGSKYRVSQLQVQPLPRVPRHDIVQVTSADGTFMDGSTSELACDGPLRDPYDVFCQGGTEEHTWTQWALVLVEVLKVI